MKNILKISFFVLILNLVGCSDATDIIQESELSEDKAFQTVADLQSGLSGVYAAYGPDFGGNGDGDAILFNDLFTDNMKRGDSGQGQGSQEYNFILQPNSSPAVTIWGNRYATLNRINRVLRAYDRIYPTLPTDDIVIGDPNSPESKEDIFGAQEIKGQLLAIRALCHLDLFEYFTEDYQNGSGLSVIKMDFVPNIEDQFERSTVTEILTLINDDITQAYELLGGVNDGNINFINENVVKAIQARVALVSGDYPTAQTLTGELLADFSLAQTADYTTMFQRSSGGGGSQGELIFSLIRRPDDSGVASLFYFNAVSFDGNPFFEASRQLFDLYDDDDVRKSVVFLPEVLPNGDRGSDFDENILLIGKYKGNAVAPLVYDIPIFRLSEMLLINAECQARANDLAGAAASIQLLREARYVGDAPDAPVFATLNQALTTILLERRKELAFEGHRYLDLKRLGGELGIGVSRLASDAASFSAPTDLPANDYRYTLPIPQTELNANNVITQNTGYSN